MNLIDLSLNAAFLDHLGNGSFSLLGADTKEVAQLRQCDVHVDFRESLHVVADQSAVQCRVSFRNHCFLPNLQLAHEVLCLLGSYHATGCKLIQETLVRRHLRSFVFVEKIHSAVFVRTSRGQNSALQSFVVQIEGSLCVDFGFLSEFEEELGSGVVLPSRISHLRCCLLVPESLLFLGINLPVELSDVLES